MLVIVQILNTVLIFAAGILLASRIYPSLLEASHVTGHDYIKDLENLSRELSEKVLRDPDTEFLKEKTVIALSLITENLVDNKAIAGDMRSRTRLGLVLLATGTFIQSLLFIFSI